MWGYKAWTFSDLTICIVLSDRNPWRGRSWKVPAADPGTAFNWQDAGRDNQVWHLGSDASVVWNQDTEKLTPMSSVPSLAWPPLCTKSLSVLCVSWMEVSNSRKTRAKLTLEWEPQLQEHQQGSHLQVWCKTLAPRGLRSPGFRTGHQTGQPTGTCKSLFYLWQQWCFRQT